MESPGASGVIFENDVDVSGSLVLDGAFAVLVDLDVGSSRNEAAIVSPGSSSSTGCGRKEEKEKNVKRVQFFVNRGKGFTTVVRCSPDAVLSDVLHLAADEYAVCGSRLVKVGCTLSEHWIGNGSNAATAPWRGASSHLDVPGQWECKVCHATRCWPARKRCYKCDAPRDTVPNNPPMAPLGRAPPQSRSSDGNEPLPGASVGSGSAGAEVGKKGEASELLQASSLLQSIMSPEDFAKYQVLVALKPKREKTREQELADRVKSLERLRSQEGTHKGQIDKLELDLQRHRDMLQGVLVRIREESEECAELGAQVAREHAPATESTMSEATPLSQCDSQQEQENDMVGQAVSEEMYLSTVDEESGDESMLLGTSTGAEDDLDVSNGSGIWERRRSAIFKNKRMVKIKDKDKGKAKPCKTIIIEEDPPPARPASGKQLADVIARLSSEELGLVMR